MNKKICLNYLKFKEVVVSLGYLSEVKAMATETPERALLFDLWKVLQGETNEFVDAENLRVMAQVVSRLIDPKRVLNVPPEHQVSTDGQRLDSDASNVGFINAKDQFCLRQCEVPRVQAHFNIFYMNRLQWQGKQLEKKKTEKAEKELSAMTFKPQIDESSQQMAMQRKKKLAAQLGIDVEEVEKGDVDPAEFLRA